MGMLPFRCCCGGEWFDFYDIAFTSGAAATDQVVRRGWSTPPNENFTAYDSGDADDPYATTNSEGTPNSTGVLSCANFSDDDLGDYFWLRFLISSTQYLQLYKCEANESGPQEQYSVSGFTVPLGSPWPHRFSSPVSLSNTGNPDHFRRDGQETIPQFYGIYQQNPSFRNGHFRCNTAGECQFCQFDTGSLEVVDIDETGSDTQTTLTAESSASRGSSDARIMIHALRETPWAAGQTIELSSPSSGVVRHEYNFYTGQQSSLESVAKTNLIATKTEDGSVTAGTEAAAISSMFSSFAPSGLPDNFWSLGNYDRNANGDEIVQIVQHECRVSDPTFLDEEWYANGTMFYSNSTFYTPASLQYGGILAAIAVDPDPALSTDTKFVILRRSSGTNTTYDIVGIDADGDDVWTKGVVAYNNGEIVAASDRYVYVGGAGMNESTETGGRVTINTAWWMVRLDGGLAWPSVKYSTTTQQAGDGRDFDCIKSHLVPYPAEINLAAQWDRHFT